MKRRTPVLLERSLGGDVVEQIVQNDKLFMVLYKNKPFLIKVVNTIKDGNGPKYRHPVYTLKGHADNLAKRLNDAYRCSDFSVSVVHGDIDV